MQEHDIFRLTSQGRVLTVDGLEACLTCLEVMRASGNISNEYYMKDLKLLRSIVPMTGLRVRTDTQGYRQVYSYESNFADALPFAENMREDWDFQRQMNVIIIDIPDEAKSEMSYYTHHKVGNYEFDTPISYEQYEAYLDDGFETEHVDSLMCTYDTSKFWVSEDEIDYVVHCISIGRCKFEG